MRLIVAFSFMLIALLFSGCGKNTGNASLSSSGFNTSGLAEVVESDSSSLAANPSTAVAEFKICVRRIRLENEDDQAEKSGDDDSDFIEFSPGLVDLSNGEPKGWGDAKIPTGFKLKRIKVKVQKHAQTCGVDYSIKFNSETATRDVEFRFRFDPPIELEGDEKIKLSMAKVVAALRRAGDAGSLNRMHEHIEAVEDAATLGD